MVTLPADVARLQAQARRLTTPMATGEIVWHAWGVPRAGVAPLVLLHGGSGSWTHWLRNIDTLLAEGRELWVPSIPPAVKTDMFAALTQEELGAFISSSKGREKAGVKIRVMDKADIAQMAEWFAAAADRARALIALALG